MSLLQAALRYMKSGKSVFSVDRGSKKPLVPWKNYQDRLPSEEEVRTQWNQHPNANIAMATGHLTGLVVIDCDSEEDTTNWTWFLE